MPQKEMACPTSISNVIICPGRRDKVPGTYRTKTIVTVSLVAAGCIVFFSKAAGQNTATAATERALLDEYCVVCHNQQAKTAGLMLDKMDLAHIPEGAETWEKAIRKLRGGMMPPQGNPRPNQTEL